MCFGLSLDCRKRKGYLYSQKFLASILPTEFFLIFLIFKLWGPVLANNVLLTIWKQNRYINLHAIAAGTKLD